LKKTEKNNHKPLKTKTMPIINKKYQELQLTDEYITDPLLMALAWKKSHHYIRTTNWYADNFELDLSALDLMQHCKDWVKRMQDKKNLNFQSYNLFLYQKPVNGSLRLSKIRFYGNLVMKKNLPYAPCPYTHS
jgi:hypothetical protein